MIFINLIITLDLFISQIICIDIKLLLLKKKNIADEYIYPAVMTFKDNEIQNNNKNIHFLLIFDYKNEGSQLTYFYDMIKSITNSITSHDKITFIVITSEYESLIKGNVDQDKNNFFSNRNVYLLNLDSDIPKEEKLLSGQDEGIDFINLLLFFGNSNKEIYYSNILDKVNKYLNDSNYPSFFFSTDYFSYPSKFSFLSDSTYIAFYPVNHPKQLNINEFCGGIIKNINKIKYKSNRINIIITSKYKIGKFYGKDGIEDQEPGEDGIFNYTFTKFQIIPGKEYSYFFVLDLPKDIKYGDRILYVTINYANLNGTPNNSFSSSLKFYNAINYFQLKKNEFCRIQLIDALEKYLIEDSNYLTTNKLNEKIEIVNDDFCGKNFSDYFFKINVINTTKGVTDQNDYNRTIKNNFYYIYNALMNLAKK